MYLVQALIFCAVVGSNIHWQWTPNQYLASFIGAGLAWIAHSRRVARSQMPPLGGQKLRPPQGRPQVRDTVEK
jgi:hypothetical protein